MRLNLVPARTGLLWVRQGIRTFWRQPLAMGGLFFMFMGLVSVLSAIPLLGPALGLALVPAATVGLIAASREAEAGRFPMPLTLVIAFRQGPKAMQAMLVLGGVYAASMMALMLLGALLAGDPPTGSGGEVSADALRHALSDSAIGWLLLIYVPVMAAFWHAPALVHWHGVSPGKSVFFSFMACWANKGAMLMFMLGWVGVFAAVGLGVSVLAPLLGGKAVLHMVLYPLVLLMAAMFHTAIWFSFRDSFISDAPGTAADAAPLAEAE